MSSITRITLVLVSVLFAPFVAAHDGHKEEPFKVEVSPTGHYGEAFVEAPKVSVKEALANPEKYTETPVTLTGEISKVCQTKGCWLTVTDGEDSIRVAFKHRFFVPMDSKGTVEVQGVTEVSVLSEKSVEHLTGDGAEFTPDEQGQVKEVRFVATGVQL